MTRRQKQARQDAIDATVIRMNLFPRRYLDPEGTVIATAEEYGDARYEERFIPAASDGAMRFDTSP